MNSLQQEVNNILIGKIETTIKQQIEKYGTICLVLIDSENLSTKRTINIIRKVQKCRVSGILIGGSTAIDQLELDKIVKTVKSVTSLPVILFPGNITGISPNADAIFFSSLLNSDNPYFISQSQALGSILVKKYSIEAIPMGYIVIGDAGTIGFIGQARGIPPNKPNLVAMYALASQYLGMRFVYLEAGSGVTSHITSSIVEYVRKLVDCVLVVGGGIKSANIAKEIANAGADIIVVGTLIEQKNFKLELKEIVSTIMKKR